MLAIQNQLPAELISYIKNAKKGVGYNKDNKEKEENKYKQLSEISDSSTDNSSLSLTSSGQQAMPAKVDFCSSVSSEEGQQEEVEPLDSGAQAHGPTPVLTRDMVKSAIVQLFDNGEDAVQRYKLKIRLNLVDGEDVEFIANLTKDMRNFKKYHPEASKELIIEMANEERKIIKKQYGSYPYVGKFHLNQKQSLQRNQIEPFTLAVVYWDADAKGWSGVLKVYDFVIEFDLFTEFVTEKQKKSGVKSQSTWTNPKYQAPRPMTWAERRAAQGK